MILYTNNPEPIETIIVIFTALIVWGTIGYFIIKTVKKHKAKKTHINNLIEENNRLLKQLQEREK